jgi:hypothetical protein
VLETAGSMKADKARMQTLVSCDEILISFTRAEFCVMAANNAESGPERMRQQVLKAALQSPTQ